MKTESNFSSVQSKWCVTIGDCETAMMQLSTPALKKLVAAYKTFSKILPAEGFTARQDFFVSQAEFIIARRANEARVAAGLEPIWK